MTESISPTVAIARRVATAAREVTGVLGLHGGVLGEVATFGPGGPVRGVKVRRPPQSAIRVHVIARFGLPLDEVAEDVRLRVSAALAEQAPGFSGARVDVHVADVEPAEAEVGPGEPGPAAPQLRSARPEVPAPSADEQSGAQGGSHPPSEQRTLDELIDLAGKRDITGRWSMTKEELIAALRESSS